MKRTRKPNFIPECRQVLRIMMVIAAVLVASKLALSASFVESDVSWQLMDARVVDAGQTSENEAGTLISRYMVEAVAEAKGSAPVKRGKFKMMLTIFSPKKDMPGQETGFWYMNGSWTITDKNASTKAKKARHSWAVVKGKLKAAMPFNPLLSSEAIAAQITVPISPIGDRWGDGQGTFAGNAQFEGRMSVKLRLSKIKWTRGQ